MNYAFTTSIGIDVSKHLLDVFCQANGKYMQFNNTAEGINKLIQWAKKQAENCLIVIEPTGGYERMLQHMILTTPKLHLSKVNARQIREFARAKGRLAKTDIIDAKIIAEYGNIMKPRILALPPKYRQELSYLTTRSKQLKNSIVRERAQLDRITYEFTKQSINTVVTFLRQQLKEVNDKIRELIKSNVELKELYDILKEVKGIGPVAASVLLSELPELGKVDHKSISSLVGVAPHNIDSGSMRGQRRIHGGRANIRSILYMAVLSAIRYNKVIRDFYQSLILRGKKPKVAIVAAMRKLLIILNATIRDHYAKKTTCEI